MVAIEKVYKRFQCGQIYLSVVFTSGSQHLEVGEPQNRIKHYLATHIVLQYYYHTDFGDPPFEKSWPTPRLKIKQTLKSNPFLLIVPSIFTSQPKKMNAYVFLERL